MKIVNSENSGNLPPAALVRVLAELPDGPRSIEGGFDEEFIQAVIGTAYRHGVDAGEVFDWIKTRLRAEEADRQRRDEFATFFDAA